MARSPSGKRAAPEPKTSPAFSSREFVRHLLGKAAEVAPSDVTALVGRAYEIQSQAVADRAKYATLAQRVTLALDLLSDHAQGACPQIPYHTVSLLVAAVHYYIEPFDVIPDFIPRVGKADDAFVFELAWRLGRPGIERWLAWKDLPHSKPPRATARRASTSGRAARRRAKDRR